MEQSLGGLVLLRQQRRSRGHLLVVLEYHWLEDTGRIALVPYVARDVTLAPAR